MGLHLAGLAVLGSLATREEGANRGRAALAVDSRADGDESAAAWLGVEPADLSDIEIAPEDIPADLTLPPTDLANRDPRPAALASGLANERHAPAPDTSDGSGRKLQPAWRRDASTLRARVTDGSDFYQPSREEIASAPSSPQALRREPIVGIGDSARTTLPRPTQAAPAAELPINVDDDEDVAPPLAGQTLVPEQLGEQPAQGEGPLDAEQGSRSYDAMAGGPTRDDRSARAASDETQPGLLDYAAASAPGPADGFSGSGPGVIPGPSSHRVTGTAPASDGWPRPRAAPIGDIGEGTSERLFSREYLEIRRRLARVLRFPKRLALLLQQGEAIVQFMVDRDGRVSGDVKLLKSAGFPEFDREALEVVHRAAPFPHLSQRLQVRMRVPFDNPIIR